MTGFKKMLEKMTKGGGVSFVIDETNEDQTWEMSNDTLTTVVPVTDDDDSDKEEEEEGKGNNDEDDNDEE
jgi:hypothetical protein